VSFFVDDLSEIRVSETVFGVHVNLTATDPHCAAKLDMLNNMLPVAVCHGALIWLSNGGQGEPQS